MLEVKDLYAGYGRMAILNGVSFSIPPASITTVIGPKRGREIDHLQGDLRTGGHSFRDDPL